MKRIGSKSSYGSVNFNFIEISLLLWYITSMSYGAKQLRQSLFTALAWVPRYDILSFQENSRRQYISTFFQSSTTKYTMNMDFNDISKYKCRQKRQATSHLNEKSLNVAEVEAINDVVVLCDDDMSLRAMSSFGGLKYINTDIDNRFRVLFVLGGPGSGKGTQSAFMEENYPVAHFSVGELLRNVSEESPHKALIEKSLVSGQIVPVEISLSLLKAAMERTPSKHSLFLVDGFPRNFDNLSGWCRVMRLVAALEAVLVYQCPLSVLQERILERAKLSGRSDDNIESVKKRFRTFESETIPVVNILRKASQNLEQDKLRWSVVDIIGDRPVEEVWSNTKLELDRLIISDVLTSNAALLKAVQSGNAKMYKDLCDESMFEGLDVLSVMERQESKVDNDILIENAAIDIITGRQVAVSYDRWIDNVLVREKRFWSHQGIGGWRNVHFVRTPLR